MATSHLTKMTTSHSLTPFTISNDCPDENSKIIYRIILKLKNNLFKETKHILPIKIHRNHLSHFLPVILLDRDLNIQNYTFTLAVEVGNRRSFYNFYNETALENMFKIFVKRHEDSQDRNKITAIPSTTYELIRNTAEYLSTKNLTGKTNNIS